MTEKSKRTGAPEIEITEKMLLAGLEIYWSCWPGLRDADPGVAETMLSEAYRAMVRAARRTA